MSKLELLAPAGNLESFYAAINAGANAIYLGLDDFNARIKADNFSVDNIKNCYLIIVVSWYLMIEFSIINKHYANCNFLKR